MPTRQQFDHDSNLEAAEIVENAISWAKSIAYEQNLDPITNGDLIQLAALFAKYREEERAALREALASGLWDEQE